MASEGGIGLLPISCCSRQHRPVVPLQTSRPSALAKRSGSPQSDREKEVGEIWPDLRQMDSNTPHPASLSRRLLLRHSSFVRAVCVNAPVRICAGGDQRWSSQLRPSDFKVLRSVIEHEAVPLETFGAYVAPFPGALARIE